MMTKQAGVIDIIVLIRSKEKRKNGSVPQEVAQTEICATGSGTDEDLCHRKWHRREVCTTGRGTDGGLGHKKIENRRHRKWHS
jgi:hypothetical protein